MNSWQKRHTSVFLTLCMLGLLISGNPTLAGSQDLQAPVKIARHIILFIGDGMQLEHEIAASRYLYGKDYELVFHKMQHFDIATWDVTTYNQYAQDSQAAPYDPKNIHPLTGYNPKRGGEKPFPAEDCPIDDDYFLHPRYATDSASAATAWATGIKTDDGNIAWLPGDPDNGKLLTIAELLRLKKGYAIGVASTVPFSHATPAAHVSHNKSRNNYFEIAEEIIRTVKPEVVIGGGHPSWDSRYVPVSLYNDAKSGALADYVFVEREAGKDGGVTLLAAAQEAANRKKKLFGLFGGAGGNFESPIPHDFPGTPLIQRATQENPLLKDVTLAGLKVLSKDPDGFFFLIEQGDIDWANHSNDYARMVGTTADLNRAVKAAVDFVDQPGDRINWDNTLLIVASDHGNGYLRLVQKNRLGAGNLPTQTRGPCPDNYAAINCGNYPDGEVTYGTTHHTNELVRLYARGAGAGKFNQYKGTWYPCTQIIDNTQIFNVLAEAAGIPDRSPLQVHSAGTPSCGSLNP